MVLSAEAQRIIATITTLDHLRTEGKKVLAEVNASFDSFGGEQDPSDLLTSGYHLVYSMYVKHFYQTEYFKCKGNVMGDWFEKFASVIVKRAQFILQIPGHVRTISDGTFDSDVALISTGGDVVITVECKIQSDIASLKKALFSHVKNTRGSSSIRHSMILFPTPLVFFARGGRAAIDVLKQTFPDLGGDVIERFVETIRSGAVCCHRLDGTTLIIAFVGVDKAEYSGWGGFLPNHGGRRGWTLVPSFINQCVEVLSE